MVDVQEGHREKKITVTTGETITGHKGETAPCYVQRVQNETKREDSSVTSFSVSKDPIYVKQTNEDAKQRGEYIQWDTIVCTRQRSPLPPFFFQLLFLWQSPLALSSGFFVDVGTSSSAQKKKKKVGRYIQMDQRCTNTGEAFFFFSPLA